MIMMIGDREEDEDENEDWRFLSFGCLFDWLSWSLETGYVSDCMDDLYYHKHSIPKSGCRSQPTSGMGSYSVGW